MNKGNTTQKNDSCCSDNFDYDSTEVQLTVSWMGVNGTSNANRLHTVKTDSLWKIFTQS